MAARSNSRHTRGWNGRKYIDNATQPRSLTHRVLLGTLDPPHSSLGQHRILPERRPLLPHQMVVAPQRQLRHVRDVVVHRPEALRGRHGVDLAQPSLVLGRSRVAHRPASIKVKSKSDT